MSHIKQVTSRKNWMPLDYGLIKELGPDLAIYLTHLMKMHDGYQKDGWFYVMYAREGKRLGWSNKKQQRLVSKLLERGLISTEMVPVDDGSRQYFTIHMDRIQQLLSGEVLDETVHTPLDGSVHTLLDKSVQVNKSITLSESPIENESPISTSDLHRFASQNSEESEVVSLRSAGDNPLTGSVSETMPADFDVDQLMEKMTAEGEALETSSMGEATETPDAGEHLASDLMGKLGPVKMNHKSCFGQYGSKSLNECGSCPFVIECMPENELKEMASLAEAT